MKKTKLMVLTLAVAIMMMGAGYAYWSDTLTINNTVSTGELNVEFTEVKLECSDTNVTLNDPKIEEDSNTKEITLEMGNLFPGAKINYGFTIKNTGTLPTKVKDISLDVLEANNELAKRIAVSGKVKYNTTTINIPKGTTMASFDKTNIIKDQTFNNKDTLILDLVLTLDENIKNEDLLEIQTLETVTTVNFKQHNQ